MMLAWRSILFIDYGFDWGVVGVVGTVAVLGEETEVVGVFSLLFYDGERLVDVQFH